MSKSNVEQPLQPGRLHSQQPTIPPGPPKTAPLGSPSNQLASAPGKWGSYWLATAQGRKQQASHTAATSQSSILRAMVPAGQQGLVVCRGRQECPKREQEAATRGAGVHGGLPCGLDFPPSGTFAC